jgi:transportin-3
MQVMQLIAKLPNHPKLRYAASLVFGRYSEWTNAHPDTIPFQLQYISSGFDDPEVMSAAALALKHICESCGPVCFSPCA